MEDIRDTAGIKIQLVTTHIEGTAFHGVRIVHWGEVVTLHLNDYGLAEATALAGELHKVSHFQTIDAERQVELSELKEKFTDLKATITKLKKGAE